MTQLYELMFIVPGSLDDAQVPEVKNRVLEMIKAANGDITMEHDMERRRLAYPIKRQTYGHYHLVQFNLEPEALLELDKNLRMDADILRHLIIKGTVRAVAEIKTMLADHHPQKETDPVIKKVVSHHVPAGAAEPGPTVKREDIAPGETKKAPATVDQPVPASETPSPAAEPVMDTAVSEIPQESIEPTASVEEPEAAVSIEELDKRLDAILDDSDIELKL